MEQDQIKIGWLYSRSMNLYGDRGNIMSLFRRAKWRGKGVEVLEYNIGDKFDFADIDLFFFGGGQDMQQLEVSQDLIKVGKKILKQVEKKGAAMLAICGGLQLMANYYETKGGHRIEGVGLFDAHTVGGEERFIGNVLIDSELAGESNRLVGFENHSGRTYLAQGVQPLGKVVVGRGNNGEDGTEGVVYQNAIGSYLHGSLLPKNPWLTDWLLLRAFSRRYGDYQLESLNDEVELRAQEAAIKLAHHQGSVKNITSK